MKPTFLENKLYTRMFSFMLLLIRPISTCNLKAPRSNGVTKWGTYRITQLSQRSSYTAGIKWRRRSPISFGHFKVTFMSHSLTVSLGSGDICWWSWLRLWWSGIDRSPSIVSLIWEWGDWITNGSQRPAMWVSWGSESVDDRIWTFLEANLYRFPCTSPSCSSLTIEWLIYYFDILPFALMHLALI